MEIINIIIVDDHLLFSNALNGLISKYERFNVLKIFSNGQELVEHLSKDRKEPDVVLMDIQMPIMNGIEATKWLKLNKPEIKVLALSMECDETTILKMLRAGAKGYLLKDIHPSVLNHAIKQVASKGFYYTETITSTLLNSIADEDESIVLLSKRERQLLKYSCSEMTYNEIASLMCVSVKTLENYRSKLFEKLHAKTRIGLVLYAIKEKIVIL